MTWTTFGALINPTLPELDADLLALAQASSLPCAVTGSANALILTPASNMPPVNAYANYMAFSGVAASTNGGATTVQIGALPALSAYKDTASGPVALAGGEIVQHCLYLFTYDSTLNSNAGGFHVTPSVLGGGLITPTAISIAGSGATITNINSAAGTAISYTVVPANSTQEQVIGTGLSNGLVVGDGLIARYFAGVPTNGLFMNPYVKATNSVALRFANPTGSSIAAFTVTVGFMGLRAIP